MSKNNAPEITYDPWRSLSQFTTARIALGRAGISLPTRACLEFQLAHAQAKDAVHIPLDFAGLALRLNALGCLTQLLQSQAESRSLYLQRPDLGRLLSASARECLPPGPADAVIVVADGLSSTAIAHHAVPFLSLLLPQLQAKG